MKTSNYRNGYSINLMRNKFRSHTVEIRSQRMCSLMAVQLNAGLMLKIPEKNFMPSAGKIQMYLPPGGNGVRIDSAAYRGYVIPPYYD